MKGKNSHKPSLKNGKDPLFEPDFIFDKRILRGTTEYLVKWKGYPTLESTWEPTSHFVGCEHFIEEFEASSACRTCIGQLPSDYEDDEDMVLLDAFSPSVVTPEELMTEKAPAKVLKKRASNNSPKSESSSQVSPEKKKKKEKNKSYKNKELTNETVIYPKTNVKTKTVLQSKPETTEEEEESKMKPEPKSEPVPVPVSKKENETKVVVEKKKKAQIDVSKLVLFSRAVRHEKRMLKRKRDLEEMDKMAKDKKKIKLAKVKTQVDVLKLNVPLVARKHKPRKTFYEAVERMKKQAGYQENKKDKSEVKTPIGVAVIIPASASIGMVTKKIPTTALDQVSKSKISNKKKNQNSYKIPLRARTRQSNASLNEVKV